MGGKRARVWVGVCEQSAFLEGPRKECAREGMCVCSLSDAGGNTPLPVCKCVSGREVGTMELLALGRVLRQGGGGSALHADSEQQAVEAATIVL